MIRVTDYGTQHVSVEVPVNKKFSDAAKLLGGACRRATADVEQWIFPKSLELQARALLNAVFGPDWERLGLN